MTTPADPVPVLTPDEVAYLRQSTWDDNFDKLQKIADSHESLRRLLTVCQQQKDAAIRNLDVWTRTANTLADERDAIKVRAEAAEALAARHAEENGRLTKERDALKEVALHATNGWACYARRKIERAAIWDLHERIKKFDALCAEPSSNG